MKKKINALVPAAIVLVLLCGAYGGITLHQKKADAAKAGNGDADQIYMTDIRGLSSISWTKDGKGLSFDKDGDAWYYKTDRDCPIRQSDVTNLAASLSRLRAERSLESPDSLSSYGLDTPSMEYDALSQDGTSNTILIGNKVPGTGDASPGSTDPASEYYACIKGNSQVYIIGSFLADTAGKDLYDFVETETLPYVTGTDIQAITVTRDGTTSHFYKKTVDGDKNIAWYKDSPDQEANRLSDNGALNNLADAVSGLSITSCTTYKASDEEMGSYGLSDPAMTLSWSYEKGDDKGSVTLDIGSPSEDGTGYYTRKDGSRAINLISGEAAEKCLNAVYPE